MAKKKRGGTHRRHHRRRGIGSTHSGQGLIMTVIGAIVGAAGTRALTRMVVPANTNPNMVAGGQALAGYMLTKHAKSPLMMGLGIGAMTQGGQTILAPVINKISGIGEDYVYSLNGPSGEDDMGYMDQVNGPAYVDPDIINAMSGNDGMDD